jgi:putative tryptophan/tyrosine transport system substrate-binding protein
LEGKNIVLELRSAEGKDERLPQIAEELVRSKVQVIVTAGSTPATVAAKRATQTIPIVFAASADPLAAGLVKSLAKPGENVTGLSLSSTELSAKRLALMRELTPKASRVAVLINPANPVSGAQVQELRAGAAALGLQIEPINVRGETEIDAVFAALTKKRPDAMLLLQEPLFLSHRGSMIERMSALGVPAMTPWKEYTQSGALVAYGPNVPDLFRRAASYVARILNGAKPGDLPVEQPTKFELIINLKTAKTLGLTISPSLRLQADELIE